MIRIALLALALTTTQAHALMGATWKTTGPYNALCTDFVKAKPRDKEIILAWAQGYFAALNQLKDVVATPVNLMERWRELNAYIVRECGDKSDPRRFRTFVGDLTFEAFEKMSKEAQSVKGD